MPNESILKPALTILSNKLRMVSDLNADLREKTLLNILLYYQIAYLFRSFGISREIFIAKKDAIRLYGGYLFYNRIYVSLRIRPFLAERIHGKGAEFAIKRATSRAEDSIIC